MLKRRRHISHKKQRFFWQNFVYPLIIIPYAFWGIYLYENGINWLSGILGFALFIIILPAIIVFWRVK
ncbi:hypothetical protein COV18_07595 [Candidatus Woesearchaeota archaeon CG10_big_fil_rev_8_21_14_0_10_37_12]|nr:MAG: hypothetical protein COV18_07595 [Candidatus Woesearchaeota archaeon CG10_big_fil_rev_8_21_14_0_10_37_12]